MYLISLLKQTDRGGANDGRQEKKERKQTDRHNDEDNQKRVNDNTFRY